MFVVETILSSQFAWVSVFSSSNLSLKRAYMNFPKSEIKPFMLCMLCMLCVCCVCCVYVVYVVYVVCMLCMLCMLYVCCVYVVYVVYPGTYE